MQEGDILTAKEMAYIEAMEELIFMVCMGNTDIDMLEEKARAVRSQGAELHG